MIGGVGISAPDGAKEAFRVCRPVGETCYREIEPGWDLPAQSLPVAADVARPDCDSITLFAGEGAARQNEEPFR